MKLLLVFRLDNDLYGLEGGQVDRIVPQVRLRPVPHAPEYVRGMFNLHGTIIPVIDLSRLVAGRDASSVMSTRVVVVRFPCHDGITRYLGLLAEKILEIRSVDLSLVEEPVIRTGGAPYLGELVKDESGLIQVIELPRLLPEAMQDTLFAAGGDGG